MGRFRTNVVSVTFPSAKRISPLTRHYGTGRSTSFGRTCRAFQCALNLVVEPLAIQRPAAVNSISNLAQLTRIKFAAEEFPISTLPFLCCTADPQAHRSTTSADAKNPCKATSRSRAVSALPSRPRAHPEPHRRAL